MVGNFYTLSGGYGKYYPCRVLFLGLLIFDLKIKVLFYSVLARKNETGSLVVILKA